MHLIQAFYTRLLSFIQAPQLLSGLVIVNGLWLITPILLAYTGHIDWRAHGFTAWLQSLGFIQLLDLPRFSLGVILIGLGFSLWGRSRIAWLFVLFVLVLLLLMDVSMGKQYFSHAIYSGVLIGLLIYAWRGFSSHSTTSTGLIAIFSILVLAMYSVVGSLYLGTEFHPPIKEPFTALYFSIISMATVGYGDIVPVTVESRMFTISIVVFGVTVFTTSVVYIAGALVRDTQQIVEKRRTHMKNHYVIVGSSLLAQYVYKGLQERKIDAVVVCHEEQRQVFPEEAVVVTGEPSSINTLAQTSLKEAQCVMALEDSDAENTFILLAANELAGAGVKKVTIINEESNRKKLLLLHADYVFSLAELGGELLMRVLNGEEIDNKIIAELLIGQSIGQTQAGQRRPESSTPTTDKL